MFSTIAPVAPSKSTNRSSWPRMRSAHSATVFGRVEHPLAGIAWVADHPGGTAGQHDRAVPELLKPSQRQQRHQIPGVQARRGGVEAGVHGDRRRGHRGGERVEVGGLRDQPTPAQFVDDAHRIDLSSPWLVARARRRSTRAAAVRGDLRVVGQPVSPRPIRGLAHPDARAACRGELRRRDADESGSRGRTGPRRSGPW